MSDKFCWDFWKYWPIWCWFKGHAFKYEPMDGDKPPFEFDYCARCSIKNPRSVTDE